MQLQNSILLVEDDKYIALALKIRLEAEGFAITDVQSCLEALEHIRKIQPYYAVIDYNLPDGNGIDLMTQLSTIATPGSLFCIIMTASKQPGLKQEALAKGALAYFEKPFTSKKLIETINAIELPKAAGL